MGRRRRSSIKPHSFSKAVIDHHRQRIDLSNENNAVNAAVLEQLSNALRNNDYFTQLSLSGNQISDECVAMLCALLKDQVYLDTLELSNCGLCDKHISYYLAPAILTRNRITRLDLSKNPRITSTCASSLQMLLRKGELRELCLIGTSLDREGGVSLLEAMETNGQLLRCQLPYSVGYEVIDRFKLVLERNQHHRDMHVDANVLGVVSDSQTKDSNELVEEESPLMELLGERRKGPKATYLKEYQMEVREQEQLALAEYYVKNGRKRALVAHDVEGIVSDHNSPSSLISSGERGLPSLSPVRRSPANILDLTQVGRPRNRGSYLHPHAVTGRSTGAQSQGTGGTFPNLADMHGSLENAQLSWWVDPAVNRSLSHLHLLRDRCVLQQAHKHKAQSRLRAKRGLLHDE